MDLGSRRRRGVAEGSDMTRAVQEMLRIFWLYLTPRRREGMQQLIHFGLKGLDRNMLFNKRGLEILTQRAMSRQIALAAVRQNCERIQLVRVKQIRLR